MKYIALLRGINVGGNNTVSMADLKRCFESLGYNNVSTYINSGNVIFETDQKDKLFLVEQSEQAIEKKIGFRVTCAVISADELSKALEAAPNWWGKDENSKHNALFVIAPKTTKDVVAAIGEMRPDYEKVSAQQSVIFWSAPLETFSRTRYSKIASAKIYQSVTIRNANTTQKLLGLIC